MAKGRRSATPKHPWQPLERLSDEHPDVVRWRAERAPGAGELNIWANDRFVVIQRSSAGVDWLSIKPRSGANHDWRHYQRIKNEVCGPEREAVELYPAESRKVDSADQFHLWVLPAGERFAFGFQERLVLDSGESPIPGTSQRPLDP